MKSISDNMFVSHVDEVQQAIQTMDRVGVDLCSDYSQALQQYCQTRQLGANGENIDYDWVLNFVMALFCILLAALAAGLTLGLLGMDPLMLCIKERASEDENEKKMAQQILPIIKQHHRLLVTLLLMNSIANEALPIFLEALVPPSVAVFLSVVFVLIFAEILPSAAFTGPNQLRLASSLIGLVKIAMFVLAPIAVPIAKLLDRMLENDEVMTAYNRGELSALIRIQYEERLASKRRRKSQQRAAVLPNHVGALDFAASIRDTVRANVRHLEHLEENFKNERKPDHDDFDDNDSIHADEVTMMEGALQMKTKVAMDVMTPLRHIFAVPHDMLLSEHNLVMIYSCGHSRVPVYQGERSQVIGIMITRQLIVVDPRYKRPVNTLPIYRPCCIHPGMHLVDVLNLFQTGGSAQKGGHMAMVCAKPEIADEALANNRPIPSDAGLMGLITLEDVLETLLQEEIYDEMDRHERRAFDLAKKVVVHWKRYVLRKRVGGSVNEPAMLSIVQQAVESNETTGLLKGDNGSSYSNNRNDDSV